MADEASAAAVAAVGAPAPAAVDESTEQANGDTTITKEDEATAGAQTTSEVTAPDGDTTEVAEGPSTGATDATPATGKKEKRKSVSGVPEHKSKKLNKKKSMPTLRLDCEPGEHYWARMKSHPPWPAIICDEQMLPEMLLASRPVSTARPDGGLRDDFKAGGKNARDRTFPVMFLSTNEFAWMPNTGLTPLKPEDCRDKLPAKMSKALQDAYALAAENHDIDYYKDILKQWQEGVKRAQEERLQQEEEADEERMAAERAQEAKDAAGGGDEAKDKKKKKARKSKAADEDVEMEDVAVPKSSKKRKKEADSDGEGSKLKKTPKVTKLNAPKTPNGEASTKKSTSKPKKKVSAPKVEEDEEEKKPQMSEAERLQQREKAILYLRHRLQKGFLSRDQAPQESEMQSMAEFFTQLENYDNLEPSIIRVTKIHKVLKAIVKLATIPNDDEHSFKKRSAALLEVWNKRLEADGDGAPAETKSTEAEVKASAANGEEEEVKAGDAKEDDETKEGAEEEVEAKAEAAADEIDEKADVKADAAAEEQADVTAEAVADEIDGQADTKPETAADEDTTMQAVEEPAEAPVEKTVPGNDAVDEAADGDVSMQSAPEEMTAGVA